MPIYYIDVVKEIVLNKHEKLTEQYCSVLIILFIKV